MPSFLPSRSGFLRTTTSFVKWELRKVMQSMGNCPSEEALLMMLMEVDEDGSGVVEFAEVRDETDRSN